MKKRTANILLAVFGVGVFICIAAVAAMAWFFASAFEATPADEAGAVRAFDEVRAKFQGVGPILQVEHDDAVIARQPPDQRPAGELKAVHMRAWKPGNELVNVRLPFSVLRLQSGPINIGASSYARRARFSMTIEDVERYGPALWVDHVDEDGSRVLVWTE
jgi:hypothetical protein